MQLLERHTQLAELETAWRDAGSGHGSVVVVTGNAGVGKTSLVRHFVSGSVDQSRVLWGACEGLLLPRPLCPFRDMFPRPDGERWLPSVDVPAEGRAWIEGFFEQVLQELASAPLPAVFVIEDLQWADGATLELVQFLADRIGRMSAVLLLTHRSDEVTAGHPLPATLATIPHRQIRRLRLDPLSPAAVADLAGHADVDDLCRLTGGNPYYLREILAAPDADLPVAVEDAVLARVAQLGASGYACAEVASVVPGRTERWLLDGCGTGGGADEAIRLGVLNADDDAVWFRHELTRQAVEQSLYSRRRRRIHGRVLATFAGRDVDPERLVHHAVQADDAAAVAKYAPVAARRAAVLGCHREAVSHYEHALVHADYFSADELTDLLDAYARECEMTAAHEMAHEAILQAVEVRETVGDRLGMGYSLGRLSRVQWQLGMGPEARLSAVRAVMALEAEPAGSELVRAYARLAWLAAMDYRPDESVQWSERSMQVARELEEPAAEAEAAVAALCARRQVYPGTSSSPRAELARAAEAGAVEAVAWTYVCLVDECVHSMRYEEARALIDEGFVHCTEHGFTEAFDHLMVQRGSWLLERGEWLQAEEDAQRMLTTATASAGRPHALRVLTLARARRGDTSARSALAEARRLAERADEAHSRLPIGLAEAELAWFDKDAETVLKAALPVLDRAREHGSPRWVGESALWLHRVGWLSDVPKDAAEPYALQICGRWEQAADCWAELGRPYEQADALADAAEPWALRKAVDIFDSLGAVARAAMVRRRLGPNSA